ncbi:MAG: DUF2723 domain-containing protein [Bacteroidota bacterium]|nr:DUF2723 domain-containing protein [Bacteroidota bacterium]
MGQFKKLNNLIGWLIFLIASLVYLFTIEQTVSFWDCGEYISTAYKLEVGHPPGAPLFQLIGRIFSLFAAAGTSEVAIAVNILSALCSSFTILFLFWTITAFGIKLWDELNRTRIYLILSSGIVGALAYTFSDSFWFSAVEGEVYAMSSFFTAITFWCILKWEQEFDSPYANRWLVLIGYLIGLSIGVHLLSLLTIPAMGMIYYYKKYAPTKIGAAKAFIISMLILGFVQGVIIPGAVSLISSFELFFTNSIGLPFNSGTIIYFLSLCGVIVFGIYYTQKINQPLWNTAILSVLVLLIGYSSFAILVVRSNANPPIDENNPEDAVGLLSYLKREQYGSWPILHGHYFNAKLDNKKPYKDGKPIYAKDEKKGKYIIIDKRKNSVPNYSSRHTTFFPRMWSNTQARHANGYRSWAGLSSTNKDKIPTFQQNLKFFFEYQIGWSYIRYFMWNFVGRQNDFMNMDGNSLYGNWESGISFIDNARLGTPTEAETPAYLKNNKAKNHYYFLPLLLGILGMFFHFKKRQSDAISVLLFFLFTGILIIVYLNITPFQPRERDYAYAGSFYAFSIWIGLGVIAIFNLLKEKFNNKTSKIIASILALCAAPVLMASQNWNDHDRSGRYTALEVAKNYLNSCDKNAILFTNGDNDTFPLWYAQEVEGIRTDIKVVNLSLFNTPWYIDQMKRATYDAAPIPSSLEHDDYRAGTRDYTLVQDRLGSTDVKDVVNFINSKSNKAKIRTSVGMRNYCPTKKLKLKVDKEKVMSFIPSEYHEKILPEIKWNIKGNGIYKNQLMVLDILANFNWERPIYFAITVGSDNFMGLQNYFQLEGLAYRLVPYLASSPDGQTGVVNIEKMYPKLMTDFKWGGFHNSDLYFDETNTRMIMNFRNNYARLADALYNKGENQKAIAVLDKCIAEFPKEVAKYSYFSLPLIDVYYKAGGNRNNEAANNLLAEMMDNYLIEYAYLSEFKDGSGIKRDIQISMQVLSSLSRIVQLNSLIDSEVEVIEKSGEYYKIKNGIEEEISYSEYRINTFLDDFRNLQSI